ncbi:MAG: polysaccharide deacetylase [Gammaproteobacteria bacterium]|nr:polysaccharide deacetylase [Gammaproteobacteria bacterium]
MPVCSGSPLAFYFLDFFKTLLLIVLFIFPSLSFSGVVLLYHHVAEDTPALTSITIAQFERHLETIEKNGYEVVPLEILTQTSLKSFSLDKKVSITFDDGYKNILTNALPLLKKRDWPFTIFVSTKFVGVSKSYLNWEDLNYLKQNGATIGNHTHSHAHLVRRGANETDEEWLARVESEIITAREILNAKGHKSQIFAYPYGEYNEKVRDIVRKLGMTGFGQQSGAIGPSSDPLILPRFPLSGVYTGIDALTDKLGSLAMPIETRYQPPLVGDNVRPSLKLKFTDPMLGLERVNCFGPGGLMEVGRISDTEISIKPKRELPVGRSRYNCTLRHKDRYFWYSQLWMKKNSDGSWYKE